MGEFAMKIDQRMLRARQFASQVIHSLDEFLPTDVHTRRRMHDRLIDDAYKANAMIVNVPDEYDQLASEFVDKKMREHLMSQFLPTED